MRVAARLTACAVLGAILASGLDAGAADASSTPTFPPIPEIHVHLPKPSERAKFNVVVEGKATDSLTSQLSGETGTCRYKEDGTVKDVSTYLRGKGATMEFDRYGKEVVIHRSGRESDSTLAVVVSTVRTAEGHSSAEPSHPPDPCTVAPTDLSTTPECGETKNEPTKMLMTYDTPTLRLNVSAFGGLTGGGGFEDRCGQDEQTGLQTDFRFAWPTPPKLEFANLPMHAIFGARKALLVKFLSSDRHLPVKEHKEYKGGPIGGTADESAFNEATLRLVRLKG